MEWGCEGGAYIPAIIMGKEDYTCPRRPILEDPETFTVLFDAYAHYSNGYLMEGGGILDQPYKLMRMLAIMSGTMLECQEEKQSVERERQAHHRRAEAQTKEQRRGGDSYQ